MRFFFFFVAALTRYNRSFFDKICNGGNILIFGGFKYVYCYDMLRYFSVPSLSSKNDMFFLEYSSACCYQKIRGGGRS